MAVAKYHLFIKLHWQDLIFEHLTVYLFEIVLRPQSAKFGEFTDFVKTNCL